MPSIFPMEEEADGILSDAQVDVLFEQAKFRRQNALSTKNSRGITVSKASKLDVSNVPKPYVQVNGEIAEADTRRLLEHENKEQSSGLVRKVEDPVAVRKKDLEAKNATAGPDWYNLPRTNLTPELKRDLQLLKLRGVLDPKRHYKQDSRRTEFPTFSQVGTLKEGPTEFFSARISKRNRKKTFVEEVLAGEHETGRFKRKYLEIQEAKRSGKKGHYKAMIARRRGNLLRR